jgi:dienelactone hydrolase
MRDHRPIVGEEIVIGEDELGLPGTLAVPPQARGIVLFAHGSGSSRHSPRNRLVADELNDAGIATLLFDLLTMDEEVVDVRTRALRFDIPLLADRLALAIDWLDERTSLATLPVGLFGASTGAAAALITAAEYPGRVRAVVSRGGRPDLAAHALREVRAATLLIVGGADEPVISMNQHALDQMHCERRMEIVPGATHLFEEPGTLAQVAELARDWFLDHLRYRAEAETQPSL